MNFQKKSTRELLTELSELKEKYNSMVELYEKKMEECRQTEQILLENEANFGKDITERMLTAQALRESEARFKALHNASFGGIIIHDKGIILECNQGLSAITGYSVEELIGMNGDLLIAGKSKEFVKSKIERGDEKPYEAVGVRKNGEEYPLRLESRNIPYKGKFVFELR